MSIVTDAFMAVYPNFLVSYDHAIYIYYFYKSSGGNFNSGFND